MSQVVDTQAAIDAAMGESERLRKALHRGSSRKVRSAEERGLAKATALAWFNSHRTAISTVVLDAAIQEVDEQFRSLLSATDRETSRSAYEAILKRLRRLLSELRGNHVLGASIQAVGVAKPESPPDFAKLIPDGVMQAALARRWNECNSCIAADAPMAAIVMMGGLLEALLLARVNADPNKASVFSTKTAPKDKSTGKTLPLKEWMLKSYIDVAHELGWISQSAKDVGEVLRDYRNYIHPYKELSHGVTLTADDAALLWGVSRSITKQLVR